MTGTTKDGYYWTTVEQEGEYAGEDVGRIWVQQDNTWSWYGFRSMEEQAEGCQIIGTMTLREFDLWYDPE